MGNLLIEESPLLISPTLAAVIGLREAIVLQQLHFLLQGHRNGRIIRGVRYIYNTYDEWRAAFKFWSVSTIKRTFLTLEGKKLVTSIQADASKRDQRKFYTIDYLHLKRLISSKQANRGGEDLYPTDASDQVDPIRAGQTDPLFSRQRRQAKKIPQSPGGGSFSSSEEEKADCNTRGHSGQPNEKVPKKEWVALAAELPAYRDFLALVGLREFPKDGRQQLARSFVNACQRGIITSSRISLIMAVQARINLPSRAEVLIAEFDSLLSIARDAAKEWLLAIDNEVPRAVTGSPRTYLKMMAAAESLVKDTKPEDLFTPGIEPPFPSWLLLALYAKNGERIDSSTSSLKTQTVQEIAADLESVPFLNLIGVSVETLGVTQEEIDQARLEIHDRIEQLKLELNELLRGEANDGNINY